MRTDQSWTATKTGTSIPNETRTLVEARGPIEQCLVLGIVQHVNVDVVQEHPGFVEQDDFENILGQLDKSNPRS